jgi:hypothetical protein
LEGRIVPDEAYIFTIEITDYRGNFNYYDPTTFSGGEYFEPAVEFKEQNRTVNYPLDRDARVRIRAGIQGGPLLKAIANWSPRLAGNNEDNWDGMDESGTLMAVRQKKFKLTAEAVTLPENTILTTGNERDTYYGYLNEIHERPRKVDRPFYKSKSTLPGYQYGDIVDYGIKLKAYLKLPKPAKTNMGGLPILDGKVPLKIFLDEDIERFAIEQRYEILYFVDFNFVMEKEEGYSPSTWIWDTTSLPEGEHILTINIATLTGQFTSASLKAFIHKER